MLQPETPPETEPSAAASSPGPTALVSTSSFPSKRLYTSSSSLSAQFACQHRAWHTVFSCPLAQEVSKKRPMTVIEKEKGQSGP